MDKKNDRDDSQPNNQQSGTGLAKRGIKPSVITVVGLLLFIVIAASVALFLRRKPESLEGRPVPAPAGEAVPPPETSQAGEQASKSNEITLTIAPEQIVNAQIKTDVAIGGGGATEIAGLRTTGSVTSNAYKETPVFPVAGGIVRQVNAELGDKVKRGQLLATIFSTDLANAQGEYLRMRAEYEEHEKAHHRTEQLVEIGAASREELEQSIAKIESMRAELASKRQQLMLLGMTAQQVDALKSAAQVNSLIPVISPAAGTILTRSVNQGEVVPTGKEIFRTADLSTVWVVGQIYEKDFSAVRLGERAAISTPAYPGRTLSGQVSYIDPRVDTQTRTAQVRIEVPNPGEMLKIGMFVDVIFGEVPSGVNKEKAVLVPKAAVQTIGSKQVVFVATNNPGEFVQRNVIAGSESDGMISIYQGLNAGERVVTAGSFLLRAESLKQRPDQSTSPNTSMAQ